jgi:hypothetical protein
VHLQWHELELHITNIGNSYEPLHGESAGKILCKIITTVNVPQEVCWEVGLGGGDDLTAYVHSACSI